MVLAWECVYLTVLKAVLFSHSFQKLCFLSSSVISFHLLFAVSYLTELLSDLWKVYELYMWRVYVVHVLKAFDLNSDS